jgi:2-keto-3-deoxy-L-rhamnonate aldolase RhmA
MAGIGVHNEFITVDTSIFIETMDPESLLVVQLERKKAIDTIHEILSVVAIDGAIIGGEDLSADLNLPGKINHPMVLECVKTLIEACKYWKRMHLSSPC